MRDLFRRFGTRFLIIPEYHREGFCAEAPGVNPRSAEILARLPAFTLVGPDYYRYPNRLFSDHVHLNGEGATKYTARIAEIVRPLIQPSGRDVP